MSHATLTRELEDWLVAEALRDADILALFETLSDRLNAAGVPLARAALSWLTLHPLFRAEQIFWRLGERARLEQYYHSTAGSEEYLRSPFHHVRQRRLSHLRRRLDGEGAMLDFDVLRDFAAQGFTDYLLTATDFRVANVPEDAVGPTGLMASWATRRPGGFADDDLDALKRIQTLMAVTCRAAIQKRVMANLADTYLGPTAGGRVLAGDIKRGDGERISAIVWFSDLRGSTRLSDRLGADAYLALLNRYFECTAQPVIDRGGEVLNFIGDGVLAIFPVRDGRAREAAAMAEAAATEALARGDAAAAEIADQGGPPFRFGIGLALGEVMFGNIGVPGRLAFSGIGRVVNQVQRVETATARLGHPLLATSEFTALVPGTWRSAGHIESGEFAEPVEVFVPGDMKPATEAEAGPGRSAPVDGPGSPKTAPA